MALCTECGHELAPGATVCVYCGHAIGGVAEQPLPAPPAAAPDLAPFELPLTPTRTSEATRNRRAVGCMAFFVGFLVLGVIGLNLMADSVRNDNASVVPAVTTAPPFGGAPTVAPPVATAAASTSPAAPPVVAPDGSFGDGTWRVGADIQPGMYRSLNESDTCAWARLGGPDGDDVISSSNAVGPTFVLIQPTDSAFRSVNCGRWERA